jgi:DNA modification methylase
MDNLDITIQPYDVWNFHKCDDLFGRKHPGRIPGQLIAHVLYFFTEQGDMVIDPMSGGGTTQDVCLAMGRQCYAFDIDGRHGRKDVIAHNLAIDGWHDRVKKADLIFWDPPYFDKMDKANIGEDGYIEGSISAMNREQYLDFFSDSLSKAYDLVKPGTRIAFLMSDWDDSDGEREGIFVWDYARILQDTGWNLIRHIQVPLSTQQVHPDIVNKFRKSRRLARLERYVLVGEK